jgi:hypothetical protein
MNTKVVGACATMWVTSLLLGCGRTPGQFLIVQNQSPQMNCVIPADVSALYQGKGKLDVRLVQDQALTAYYVFPLLENDLPPPTAGQSEDPNRIALSGFDVDLSILGSAPPMITTLFQSLDADPNNRALLHFRLPWSGSVASGGGHTATTVDAVPATLARRIRDTGELETTAFFELEATITATGDRLAGNIDSDPFSYPVVICEGCLIANVASCPYQTAVTNQGNACNVAQDDPVDCCSQSGALVCPPTVSTP